MKESYIFLADGFEEIEAISVVDLLRRAGIPVKTISISNSLLVTGAHGVAVKADCLYDATLVADHNWLILPGGMPGAENLHKFAPLQGLLKSTAAKCGKIAAICAAPAVVLAQAGLLKGRKATCYPGFEEMCEDADLLDTGVVADGNIVTAQGPAFASQWALAIIKKELGEEESNKVAGGLLLFPRSEDGMDFYFG